MATDHEALEDLLLNARVEAKTSGETADDILRAGWRPPPRVITTVEELDALPNGSVVMVDGIAAQRLGQDWRATNAPALRIASAALLHLRGHLTLVHNPTEEARDGE